MAYFGEQFIEDVRRAVSVRSLVERRHKLRKRGAHEFIAIDDNSLTVNDQKNIWKDFSSGKGGDVFDWQRHVTGCTFEDAVTQLAQIAGIPLPRQRAPNGSGNGHHKPNGSNGHAEAVPPRDDVPWHEGPPAGHPAAAAGATAQQKAPTAVYNYFDNDDVLLYQVCRFQWVEHGKPKKITPPRCPVDGEPGHWRWGLSEGEYIRSPINSDWYRHDEKRAEQWAGAEVRHFDEVRRTLYRLPEVLDELRLDASEQQIIYIPEGEKDAETLRAWGLLSTTNMGGVNGWLPHFPEYLAGADVVILPDHDSKPNKDGVVINHGMRFAQLKAHSLKHLARRVRVLDWKQHWPGVPHKGDVTKWRDEAGGNLDRFLEIVDKLKDWVPEPPDSLLGALRFADLDKPRKQLQWLIKGVLQRGEMSVWFGDWGTGKSFLLTDAAFAIARGISWMGNRTFPGLVLYQAGEGGTGMGNRMEAYRRHHHLPKGDDVSFVALRSRLNLFDGTADLEKLISEVKAWSAFYDQQPELVVIDTFSAATAGADENSGRDVGKVLEHGRRISTETGAHVALVHHVPKTGNTPRGWSGFLGNVESAVLVETLDNTKHEEANADGSRSALPIHQYTVVKQKDAPNKTAGQFVLPQVHLGTDGDGDAVTSCVLQEVGDRVVRVKNAAGVVPANYHEIKSESNFTLMRSLMKAMHDKGRPAPNDLKNAPPGAKVVTIGEWQTVEAERLVGHYDQITTTLKGTIRKRIQRACETWERSNILVKEREFIWRTTRKIHGIDAPPAAPKPEPAPLMAPGEDPNDVTSLFKDR